MIKKLFIKKLFRNKKKNISYEFERKARNIYNILILNAKRIMRLNKRKKY